MTRLIVTALLFLVATPTARAQIPVIDAAVIARNTIAAIRHELQLDEQREQHLVLQEMRRRLSEFSSLVPYEIRALPPWRQHGPDALLARVYTRALGHGDRGGSAYGAVVQPLASAVNLYFQPADVRATVDPRMATIEAADAAAIAATDASGQIRFGGAAATAAIEALGRDVTNPSPFQSATAAADKLSGAALIAAQQRQDRLQLLLLLTEQLVLDNKRQRDSEAATLNMQLRTWSSADAANAAFAAGNGDALATWRQP